MIVLMHRIFGWLVANNNRFARLTEGNKILLFEDGKFIAENLKMALVSKEDALQGVRKGALTENLDDIDKIYIERNGEISAIKKN